ncbi:HHL091Cp [Eremothecium sinecaudum]|uniref:HHL091Cp n=1 Tax=Eremothecium sinecaudum TaxID=45286 RepID=A0A0X8HW91_9SACH|nr:HHL091Cp [Eremothecium sinecaudum]AMD22679.1 HHL091Cp [Eremothecium sinecaudum]
MSFWPIGQSVNNSKINRLLDDYFRVLHSLEDEKVAPQTDNVGVDVGGANVSKEANTQGQDREERVTTAVEAGEGEKKDEIDYEDGHFRPEQGDGNPWGRNYGETLLRPGFQERNKSEPESVASMISIPSTTSSPVSISGNDAYNFNASVPLTKESLNCSFIDDILKESEIINELVRQNNTILDFFCFGYFFDAQGNRVEHIDYLIDQLLFSIDRVNEDSPEIGNTTVSSQRQHDHANHSRNMNADEDSPDGVNENDSAEGSSTDNNEDSIIPLMYQNEFNSSSHLYRANTIAEIFALDNWLITETFVKDFTHLTKIWSILYHKDFKAEKSPLVPIFLKINQNWLVTRQDQFLNFIRTRDTLVDDMLAHLEISVLMDFFLKLISTDKQESPTGIIELAYEQDLIPKLLAYLDNDTCSADIQACAGDFIKALISISTNAPLDEMSIGPNSLTRKLCSEESVNCFIDAIINKRGSALTTAVSVVIELIRKNNSDYDQINLLATTVKSHPPSMRDPVYLGTMLRMFAENLPKLLNFLADIEKRVKVAKNQLGMDYKPLGFERFKIVELIAELLHCSNMCLMNSKKAERIVKERDEVRQHLVMQLQDALTDLNMNDSNVDSEKNNEKNWRDLSPTNDTSSPENTALSANTDDDVDESFEIPYVNKNQNAKLRKNPTVGDFFKIQLYDTQLLPKLIQLFMEHPWNNFWHNVIFDIIQQIFNGRMDFSYNSFLVYSLFKNSNAGQFCGDPPASNGNERHFYDFQITRDLILQGYKDSHAFYEEYNTSLGYMGHLVLISEEIVKFSKVYKVELISPEIHDVLQDPDWIFYSEDALNETRLMYSKILGGGEYGGDTPNNNSNEKAGTLNAEDSDAMIVGDAQANYKFSTQADLHKKLKEKLIKKSQDAIDLKNKENGVIILGPP